LTVTAAVPAVAEGAVGSAGMAGKVDTVPCVAPALPVSAFVSTAPTDAPLLRNTLAA
jgi:hypothetical protein